MGGLAVLPCAVDVFESLGLGPCADRVFSRVAQSCWPLGGGGGWEGRGEHLTGESLKHAGQHQREVIAGAGAGVRLQVQGTSLLACSISYPPA